MGGSNIQEASIIEVKDYLDYPNSKEFAQDWKLLSLEEKTWFKVVVAEVLGDTK